MSLAAHVRGLRQRFDSVALRPPADAQAAAVDAAANSVAGAAAVATDNASIGANPSAPAQRGSAPCAAHTANTAHTAHATHAALQAWCWHGAGPGTAPAWWPGALPRVASRLAVATLRGAAGAPAAATIAWADSFARQLDGSNRLAALPGRAAGLAFRLGVKLHDAMWWRPRQPDDPWDAGWAIDTAPALRHLQNNFQPRRATLILADARRFEPLSAGLAGLAQRQAGLRHPVRWLWTGGEAELPAPAGLAITRHHID